MSALRIAPRPPGRPIVRSPLQALAVTREHVRIRTRIRTGNG